MILVLFYFLLLYEPTINIVEASRLQPESIPTFGVSLLSRATLVQEARGNSTAQLGTLKMMLLVMCFYA